MDHARRLLRGKNYSQDDLIPFVILVIGSFGGTAFKHEVDEKIYKILQEEFSSGVYHKTVANCVPRWRHDIAWAKERAKQIHAYIKSAEDSGRGVWQLTEEGKTYCKKLMKQLERSVVLRKKSKNS